jgi:hypothetical protein
LGRINDVLIMVNNNLFLELMVPSLI